MGLARDCSPYTLSGFSNKEAFQDIARAKVQKRACGLIYWKKADRAETVQYVTSSQKLKNLETISIEYSPQQK